MTPGLLAVLAACAVLLLPGRGHRTGRAVPRRRAATAAELSGPRPRAATAALVAVGAAVVVGGGAGVLVGAVCGAAAYAVLRRLEPRARRREREEVERAAPLVLDLVAACLASGAALDVSVVAAAEAVGGATARLLLAAVAASRLGASPASAWREVAAQPALAGLARAVVRAHDTGAPLGDVLPRLAATARSSRRVAVEARVRTAAVRLTGPLGLAFLPAFVLLGVVPVVASWIGTVL